MNSDMLRYFRLMLRARRFDEALCEIGDQINDTYHVSIGLETSAAAIACAQESGDYILLNHRNHGQLAACGSDLERMYRELLGRDGGPQRGKLGSFHLVDSEKGIPYVSAMLAGGVPIAIGMAVANSRQGKDSIAFAYLGDGAMEEGIIYESFNIASKWNAPVVIVCDNNSTRTIGQSSKFCELAKICGLGSFAVNAQFPFEVFSVVHSAANAARNGEGPRFVEVISEPWPGNATGNHPRNITGFFDIPSSYSSTDGWSLVDPLAHVVKGLLSMGFELTELIDLDAEITTEVNQAITSALEAPLAPSSVIFEDIWGER